MSQCHGRRAVFQDIFELRLVLDQTGQDAFPAVESFPLVSCGGTSAAGQYT